MRASRVHSPGAAGYVVQGPPVGLGEVFFGEGGAEAADDEVRGFAGPVADGLGGELLLGVLLGRHGATVGPQVWLRSRDPWTRESVMGEKARKLFGW